MAIDEKKLIEACEKYLDDTYTFLRPLEYEVAMVRLREIIEAQPKLDVPDTNVVRWIPCSEKLPDDDLDVLVCCKSSDSIWIAKRGGYNFLDLKDVWVVHPKGYFEKHEVIAWMPLPEAYKGE